MVLPARLHPGKENSWFGANWRFWAGLAGEVLATRGFHFHYLLMGRYGPGPRLRSRARLSFSCSEAMRTIDARTNWLAGSPSSALGDSRSMLPGSCSNGIGAVRRCG